MAWQLHSQIARGLLRYHENIALQKQLTNELSNQNELVKILEKRVRLGRVKTESYMYKLVQQKTHYILNKPNQPRSAQR